MNNTESEPDYVPLRKASTGSPEKIAQIEDARRVFRQRPAPGRGSGFMDRVGKRRADARFRSFSNRRLRGSHRRLPACDRCRDRSASGRKKRRSAGASKRCARPVAKRRTPGMPLARTYSAPSPLRITVPGINTQFAGATPAERGKELYSVSSTHTTTTTRGKGARRHRRSGLGDSPLPEPARGRTPKNYHRGATITTTTTRKRRTPRGPQEELVRPDFSERCIPLETRTPSRLDAPDLYA